MPFLLIHRAASEATCVPGAPVAASASHDGPNGESTVRALDCRRRVLKKFLLFLKKLLTPQPGRSAGRRQAETTTKGTPEVAGEGPCDVCRWPEPL
jgi:hypothetical protein